MVSNRVRESLAGYEQEPEFKAIAIAREGWGVAFGASDIESAKTEALDRCRQRDETGYCRIYATGNKVVWPRALFPRPFDVRTDPLEAALTREDGALFRWAIRGNRFESYLTDKNHKALAVSRRGSWVISGRSNQAEAARLAVERCSDLYQMPCLLLSVDGFPTVELPRAYRITQPFTLTGEKEMTEPDKERIAQVYTGKYWRAVAQGISRQWYAVGEIGSETEVVEQVIKACHVKEPICALHAIGNFRVDEPVR